MARRRVISILPSPPQHANPRSKKRLRTKAPSNLVAHLKKVSAKWRTREEGHARVITIFARYAERLDGKTTATCLGCAAVGTDMFWHARTSHGAGALCAICNSDAEARCLDYEDARFHTVFHGVRGT